MFSLLHFPLSPWFRPWPGGTFDGISSEGKSQANKSFQLVKHNSSIPRIVIDELFKEFASLRELLHCRPKAAVSPRITTQFAIFNFCLWLES